MPVAYKPVLSTVPELVSDFQPDISLHIGVAEGRTYFAVEQTSRRGVYSYGRDVNGEVFPNADGEKLWGDQATVLSTDINLHGVVDEWQKRTAGVVWPKAGGTSVASKMASTQVEVKLREDVLKVEAGGLSSFEGDDDDDVRWSDNVGTYLCAFIYYTSMVEMSRETVGHRRDTAFSTYAQMVESRFRADCSFSACTTARQRRGTADGSRYHRGTYTVTRGNVEGSEGGRGSFISWSKQEVVVGETNYLAGLYVVCRCSMTVLIKLLF